MQRLDLNLATNPFRNNTLLWLGYGGAAVLLVLFSVWNVRTFVEYRAKLDALEDTLGDFESHRRELETRSRRAVAGIRRFDIDGLNQQASKANEVIEWKAFSWTRLFNRMAEIQPHQVKMVSIRPVLRSAGDAGAAFGASGQAESVPVLVEGIARNLGALWELQNALMGAPYFGRVEPERLNRGEQNEIVFQLRFEYYPAQGGAPPAEEPEAIQTVSDTAQADAQSRPAPAEETADEPAPAEPPRRQLPPVVEDQP